MICPFSCSLRNQRRGNYSRNPDAIILHQLETFILYEYVMSLFSVFLHQLESFIILHREVITL